MSKLSISIIVPIYNEEEAIISSIFRNITVLQSFHCDFEIILVNDGSKDNSLEIIKSEFSKLPYVRILSYEENGGIGKAIRSGLDICSKEYILCVPVDSPLNNDMFGSFVSNIGKADVIVSYRRERIGYSYRMKINSYAFHLLISKLFQMRLTDYNWIHCYHRKIFDEKKITLHANGIFILAEVLILAQRNKYTIIEIPVDQEIRLTGIATASKLSAIINTLKEMVAFAIK